VADPATDPVAERDLHDEWRRSGIRPLPSDLALIALRQVATGDEPALVVADVDWPRLVSARTAIRGSRFLLDVPEAAQVIAVTGADGSTGNQRTATTLAAKMADLSNGEQDELLLHLVRTEVAAVLAHADPQGVDVRRSLKDLGFDSLAALTLRNRLNAATGLRLPSTLAFDHPTPYAVAGYLRGLLIAEPTPPAVESELDRLDSILSTGALDVTSRNLVSTRLTALLAGLTGGPTGDDAGGGAANVADQLEDATDDDIFAFIDNQLDIR
jgi:Mrp family chromosome partitioning ATPase